MKANNSFIYLFGIIPIINLVAPFSYYHFPGQSLVVLIVVLILAISNRNKFDYTRIKWAWFFVGCSSLVVLFSIFFNQAFPPISLFSGIIYGFLCITLKDIYKIKVFDIFIKTLCVFLIVSIIEYYVFLISGLGVQLGLVYRSDYFPHYHLVFNLIKVTKMRYQFIAAEPGDIGTLCGFLLFIIDGMNRYKKELFVIIIAGLTSLSFAFYIFFIIFLISSTARIKIKQIVFYLALLSLVAFFMYDRIEQYIINRYTEEEYDNRSSDSFDLEFSRYIKTNDVWFGKGYGATDQKEDLSNVVGVQRELYEVGIWGVVLFFFAFSVPFLKLNPISSRTFLFFMVFWLSYYQRSNIYNFGIEFLFFNMGALSVVEKLLYHHKFNQKKIYNHELA